MSTAAAETGKRVVISHKDHDHPATAKARALQVSPAKFPDVAATLTRLFAHASTELARMKAGHRQ